MYKKCEINEDYLYGKSYIKLKIKNKGKNRVFYARDKEFPSSFIPPNEVIINNCRQTDVQYEYEFQNENNIIILIWYEPLDCLHTSFINVPIKQKLIYLILIRLLLVILEDCFSIVVL